MASAGGTAVIVIVVILLVAVIGWVVFTQVRARRLGLPPPSLASYIPFMKSRDPYGSPSSSGGGLSGWISNLKNKRSRTARGAYEPSGGGPLDPDDAWDARVHDNHGYYEDQELGNTGYRGATAAATAPADYQHQGPGAREDLGGSGYEMNLPRTPYEEENRGRQRPERNPFDDDAGSREEAERGRQGRPGRNPFDDDAEAGNFDMRGVSPRPLDNRGSHLKAGRDESPASRRSVFREEV